MKATTKTYRLPLPGSRSLPSEPYFVTPFAIKYPMPSAKQRGRRPGPTNQADEYVEQHALHFSEYYGLPLMTAIQYAVDTLHRYVSSELRRLEGGYDASTSESRADLMALAMIEPAEPHRAVRADRRRRERQGDMWGPNFDDDEVQPILLGPPNISRDHPAVKRNYERMIRHYRGPR